MKFENLTFEQQEIHLDDNEFQDCVFRSCTFVYSGGPLPSLVRCAFYSPTWVFADAAANTLLFMTVFYHGLDEKFIEATFDNIRRGGPLKQEEEASEPPQDESKEGTESETVSPKGETSSP